MKRSDLPIAPIFFLLAILFLWPVTFGGRTLIPADNLFAFQPWQAYAAQFNATVPHNELLSDLLLENYPWKQFIVQTIRQGQIPLWNPYLFTGLPFLAAGQHSALYPFSILFYIFPVAQVYGWFVALQLGIAGLAMYAFARALGLGRAAALVSALTYEFSGFFLVSLVFPMVISAACWLPALLLCEEHIIRALARPRKERGTEDPVCAGRYGGGRRTEEEARLPRRATGGGRYGDKSVFGWTIAGALLLGISLLAGHVEIAYYNLIVLAMYAIFRLAGLARAVHTVRARQTAVGVLALGTFALLGVALAAVQIVPLYELVSHSFRQGSQPYETVAAYAYPLRQVITFFIPDFFGNPSHHSYFDLFSFQDVPVTQNAAGQPTQTVFWGVKNYVEAGSYAGILPVLLALGVCAGLVLRRGIPPALCGLRPTAWFFTLLAIISLLFVFGTPLYAILFYALPGFSQLHSPFRWVYPYTFSIAVLAGIGFQWLAEMAPRGTTHFAPAPFDYTAKDTPFRSGCLSRFFGELVASSGERMAMRAGQGNQAVWRLAWLVLLFGALIVVLIAASLLVPGPFLALAERALRSSELAQAAFPDARAFYSYEAVNCLKFALCLAGAGLALLLAARGFRYWKPVAVIVIAADLLAAGYGFTGAADPALLQFVPPAVKFLQQDSGQFRVATLNAEGEKTFNANAGMPYGLQDVRGYDSIIPRQYADWMNLIEGQGELIYNRIAPFYWRGSLDSALVDLAGVKYVLTTQLLLAPKFTQVYTGELSIYQNAQAMPRAFLVSHARPLGDLAQLKSLDPRAEVLLEGAPLGGAQADCPMQPAAVSYPSPNDAVVSVHAGCAGWLVLADAYFDGWQAFDSAGSQPERELTIYRADGNFRAVQLSAGEHVVRFRYNPLSFRVGLYLSFFAAMALLLLGGVWTWGRRGATQTHERTAARVLKNSALPMATSLLNKAVDTLFAAFMLRVLGPENAGKFAFAIIVIGYCDIVMNFGLSTLVTRDVSRDRSQANRYLSNTSVMRVLLLAALAPIVALYMWARGLPDDTTLAITLLFIGLIPSSISASLSAIFYAAELMEYPAAITVVTTLLKVTLSTVILLAGLGFVGLAGANIAVNLTTMLILLVLCARKLFMPRLEFDFAFGRHIIGTSYPLMLNDMLSRLFNRVDALILQPLKGDAVFGYYSTAYKYLDGINILPSTFTIALFPVLSRYAAGAPDALLRAYLKSLKYLVIIAMPIMLLSFAYADFIIFLFGGEKYLPDSAIALRLIIGFLPLSFINNVTHYVLIAVDQQKFLTKAFVVGAIFNVVANLVFIPAFSYQASAVITIFSELVLLIPFYYGIRKHVGKVDWLEVLWRPAAATAAMAASLWLSNALFGAVLGGWVFLVVIPAAMVTYVVALLAARTFNADDWEMLRLMIPGRLRKT